MMRLVAMRVLARMAAEGYVHSAIWPLGPIRASAGTVTLPPLPVGDVLDASSWLPYSLKAP